MAAVGRPAIGKLRHVRVSDTDWEALKAAAASSGADASTVLRELIAWYLHRGPRPARPDAVELAAAHQASSR
jgi:hypothetical protein